ncbi:MAG: histidine kinase [Candidatus Aminicenantes bacterium]
MIDDKEDKLIRNGGRGWVTLYGLWSLPALIVSGAFLLIMDESVKEGQWLMIFLDQLVVFNFFASICPFIYRLSYHFRFTRSRWPITLVVHIFISVLVVLAVLVLHGVAKVLIHSAPMSLLDSIKQQFTDSPTLFRSFSSIFFYILVVLGMTLIRENRKRKQHEKRTNELELRAAQLGVNLTTAKLQSLKMQLQPHFLFNALNSISALVESKQNDLAFKTIAQLGDLLRAALDLPDKHTIPLHQELEFIDKYLTIERIRFFDRLKTKMDIPDNCRCAMVPALILQPLVENSIRHAVTTQPGPIQININARKHKSFLVLEISDNGPGLVNQWSVNTHGSIGLKNVQERLKLLYNDTSQLKVFPAKPTGVVAQITIPYSSISSINHQPNNINHNKH